MLHNIMVKIVTLARCVGISFLIVCGIVGSWWVLIGAGV